MKGCVYTVNELLSMNCFCIVCRNNMTNLVESFEAAVNHTRAFVPKPLLIDIGKSKTK